MVLCCFNVILSKNTVIPLYVVEAELLNFKRLIYLCVAPDSFCTCQLIHLNFANKAADLHIIPRLENLLESWK